MGILQAGSARWLRQCRASPQLWAGTLRLGPPILSLLELGIIKVLPTHALH